MARNAAYRNTVLIEVRQWLAQDLGNIYALSTTLNLIIQQVLNLGIIDTIGIFGAFCTFRMPIKVLAHSIKIITESLKITQHVPTGIVVETSDGLADVIHLKSEDQNTNQIKIGMSVNNCRKKDWQ